VEKPPAERAALEPPRDTTEPAEPKKHRHERSDDGDTRKWQSVVDDKGVHLKVRVVVQPMLRYSHNSNLPDDNVDLIIRRARFGLAAKLPEHLRLKFEIQIKNMHFGLSNLYGSWSPNKDTEIYFGFIKAPGGLERDSYSFDEPFIERSVVAFLTYDHEMGAKVDGYFPGRRFAYAASITRNAPPAVDGGDPEDKPVYPQGVEADDITRAASKWNAAARLQAIPNDEFEAGVTGGVRYRPDEPDFGDRAAEPYDTSFMDPKPYRGTSWHVSADLATSLPHFRAMAEGGFRQDGQQLTYVNNQTEQSLDGHLRAWLGYLTAGFAPVGTYGAAADNAPLLSGFELVARLEGARILPVDQPQAVTFVALTGGLHWEATRHLRLQWDYAYEWFGKHDVTPTTVPVNLNANARQWFAQFWATLRL
jgi:hypothetical protein